jgi:hypothetical protein
MPSRRIHALDAYDCFGIPFDTSSKTFDLQTGGISSLPISATDEVKEKGFCAVTGHHLWM